MKKIQQRDKRKIYNQTYKRSVKGLIANLYKSMRDCSRKRNHPLPDMSLEEFRSWAIMNNALIELYGNWCSSGYVTDLRPSIDRIDINEPYVFENIRVLTWVQNREIEYQRRRELTIWKTQQCQ